MTGSQAAGVPVCLYLSSCDVTHPTPVARAQRSGPTPHYPRLSRRSAATSNLPFSCSRSGSAELGYCFAPGGLCLPISSWKLAYFEVGLAGCTHLLHPWENGALPGDPAAPTPPRPPCACSRSSASVSPFSIRAQSPLQSNTQISPCCRPEGRGNPTGLMGDSCLRVSGQRKFERKRVSGVSKRGRVRLGPSPQTDLAASSEASRRPANP